MATSVRIFLTAGQVIAQVESGSGLCRLIVKSIRHVLGRLDICRDLEDESQITTSDGAALAVDDSVLARLESSGAKHTSSNSSVRRVHIAARVERVPGPMSLLLDILKCVGGVFVEGLDAQGCIVGMGDVKVFGELNVELTVCCACWETFEREGMVDAGIVSIGVNALRDDEGAVVVLLRFIWLCCLKIPRNVWALVLGASPFLD